MRPDPWLLILVMLLVASLVMFFIGWFPYPFGLLILTIAIVARWLAIQPPPPTQ